jgi:hypothetical protein
MSIRCGRNRKFLSLESLEVRTALSHAGVVAHAISHLHSTHASAHVQKLVAHQSQEHQHARETHTDTGASQGTGSDSSSSDPAGQGSPETDSSGLDANSPDPKGHH